METHLQTQITLHDRAITKLCYSRQHSIFLTASRHPLIGCFTNTGALLGTYEGLKGAVYSISTNKDSTFIATGSSDMKYTQWDLETGQIINSQRTRTTTRANLFTDTDTSIGFEDDSMNKSAQLVSYDFRTNEKECFDLKHCPTSAVTFNNALIFSDTKGSLHKMDLRKLETVVESKKTHFDKINELSSSFCGTFFITASSDSSAKIVDYDFNIQKVYKTVDPCNTSKISRTNDRVFLGGGIPARDVTTSGGKGRFELSVYDAIVAEKVGWYEHHFAPVNTLLIDPCGDRLVSGSEDGTVWVLDMKKDLKDVEFVGF